MTIPIIDEKQILENIAKNKNPYFGDYFAYYSTWFGGIIKNPHMMLLPIDDHMVHRGDGVFEAIKAVDRSVYLFDEHLERLYASAEKVSIKPSLSLNQLKEIVLETLRVADQNDVMIRIFLSRGPGNFSVSPYDSVGSQFYVVLHKLTSPSQEKYANGVVIGKSSVYFKPSWMAQIKSCNYLPNVLMRKEAIDRNLDFVIGTDEQGYITESATENVMIVNNDGVIVHPKLDNILKGTTMLRTCELARENGFVTKVKSISMSDLLAAREVIVAGTTINVLSVVKFENEIIGTGKPGPVAKKLLELILQDIKMGMKRTAF